MRIPLKNKAFLLIKKPRFSFALFCFPGQGVQKIGMHLPYINDNTQKLLNDFNEALNYPVFLLISVIYE